MFDDETIHSLIIPDPREVYGFNAPEEELQIDPDDDTSEPFGYWNGDDEDEDDAPEEPPEADNF